MTIRIYAINKLKNGPEQQLFKAYLDRMTWPVKINEIQVKQGASSKSQESQQILKALKPDDCLILLDETGKNLSTHELLSLITEIQTQKNKVPAFAIGGAEGHSDEIRAKASYAIAFGQQTWPHKLVRVMLMEQVYRCQSLAQGHPYHKS